MAEECARILVASDVDLVLVPNQQYMYSTTSWPFSEVINKTPGFNPTNHRRPIVLNYPLGDSDRLLLHPIFAHELGHSSCQEHGLVAIAEARLDLEQSFIDALEKTIEQMAERWTAPKERISGTLRALLRSWLEELLCDHMAIETTGPAFIWAFAMFVMPFSYGEPGSEHPPNTVRLRLALEHLDRRGWRPYMERTAPSATAWLDDIAADAEGPLTSEFSFLRDQLMANAETLQGIAIDQVGDRALDRQVCEAEADEAAGLLSELILPLGLDAILDGRSILIGGWQQALKEHGDSPTGMVQATSDVRLQDLVGKAMEMSVVSNAWEDS
jgi:hypothetical protein